MELDNQFHRILIDATLLLRVSRDYARSFVNITIRLLILRWKPNQNVVLRVRIESEVMEIEELVGEFGRFNDEEFWEIKILLGKRFDFRNNCLIVLEIKKLRIQFRFWKIRILLIRGKNLLWERLSGRF